MDTEPELELVDERPRQFGLIHLLVLIAVLALASALLAPLFRTMTARQAVFALMILLVDMTVVAATFIFCSMLREKVLSVAGRRVGQTNVGMARSRALGRTATACNFFFMAIVYLANLILAILFAKQDFPWIVIISQVQVGIFTTILFLQLWWDRDFGAIEFFENGMAAVSFKYTPWDQIIVRPCKLYENGVNLHIQSGTKHSGATMMTVFVSQPLKQYLLKHHGEESQFHKKSPG
ncbi:hypothetical protein [Bremerella alba]|uniref:Uncharacterized protein n=1 Tax=Bremerella alba TaxID=980252 RepID=A0A7V8V6B3_9BACT|nr:hypothetical protein [Bremerella alba]MBA2115752.1 hypothetical protein [Bremerella alba]